MDGFSGSVWEREGAEHGMNKNAFVALVSFWTASGIAASAWAATISLTWQVGWPLLLGVSASSILGVVIALISKNPMISIVGYAMVCLPLGLLLGPVVAMYTVASVVKVFMITTGMVLALGLVGTVIPDSLESWGSYLFGGLLILLLGSFLVPIAGFFGIPVKGAMTMFDWFGVILFGGYVVYDMNRAMRVERTLDNSIDCAVAMYLDFINLFVRLLSLTGQKKD